MFRRSKSETLLIRPLNLITLRFVYTLSVCWPIAMSYHPLQLWSVRSVLSRRWWRGALSAKNSEHQMVRCVVYVWLTYPASLLSSTYIHTQTSSKSSPSSHSDHIPCLHWCCCCCCRRSPRTRIKEQFNGMENIIGTTTLLPRESPGQLSIYTHQYVTKRPDKSGF